MRKYEEKKYLFENIKDHIYPWVKEELRDSKAQNGKNISEKDTPIVSFINGLSIIFVIKRDEDVYEVLKDNMLPPGCDVEALYYKACENLARDVEFVFANTWYGGFAVLAGGGGGGVSLIYILRCRRALSGVAWWVVWCGGCSSEEQLCQWS